MTSPWQSSSATASRSNTGKQQLRFDLALNQSRKTRRISYLWFFQLKSLLAKNVPVPTRATVPKTTDACGRKDNDLVRRTPRAAGGSREHVGREASRPPPARRGRGAAHRCRGGGGGGRGKMFVTRAEERRRRS